MQRWTSCQYDGSLHLVSVTSVEGGFNPKQQATRRSHEYERDHRGCAAIEVEGGFENCPIDLVANEVIESHSIRGK